MASGTTFSLTLLLHLGAIFLNKSLCEASRPPPTSSSQKFPSILIFGDSSVDTGNNNYIKTLFKANYLPYGQDFPGKVSTGRFSNGKLIPDIIASMLGIKEAVPPFLDPNLSEDELVTGVSFASAGSGFDDLTTVASNVIPVSKQIELFKDYIARLKSVVGEEMSRKIVGSALVIISAGTNDWGFNFYNLPTRKLEFDVSEYQDFLQNRIRNFVKELYSLGCRAMLVSGLPPIGCLPIEMVAKLKIPYGIKCLEDQNSDAQSYNEKLEKLLAQLQATLPESKIIYVDVYYSFLDMLYHPEKYGFVETRRGCCGTGLFEASMLCNPKTPKCEDPSQYLFWDAIHPSEAAYQHLAKCLEENTVPKLF